jgi:hypothetical protein
VIWLALAGLTAAAFLVARLRRLVREHGLGPVLWRFIRGRHLDGKYRTDAGWSRKPARVLHQTGHASWWAHQTERARAGYRLVVVGLAAGVAAMWVLARPEAPWLSVVLAAGLAVLGGWRAWLRVIRARHQRQVVRPMSAALAPYLGTAPRTVEAGLSVRRDFADAKGGEHVATVVLPDHWPATAELKARVEEIAHARLGVALKPQWRTSQYPMVLGLTRAPTPPERVLLAGELAGLDGRPAHKVFLGRAADGEPRWWDRSSEDPMVAVHGGSRRGKTSLLLSVASQDLVNGGRVTAIDPKRVGLLALAECPGFTLLHDPRDVPAMWQAVADFRRLVEARYDRLAEDPTLEFRYELLMMDEISMLSGLWAAHWRQVKEKSDPSLPPVWGDVAACCWLGAQARAHVIVAGQRLDFQILGGMLGSFGTRLLAGYLPQDYVRLVGVTPVLRSQKSRGRFLYYAGDDPEWVQLVFGKPEEWRDWVLARTRPGMPDLAANAGHATRDIIGLAAGAVYLGLTADAFRKRLERQGRPPGEFRVGNQPAWKPADLDRWAGRVTAPSAP